jgi:N-acetylglucosaminyl-diphospho-decaprenol L-rhamnosyltransferase
MIDVSILVISYNTKDLTLETLRSLPAACGEVTAEIIVVDNASTDGSADAICATFPDLSVARSASNLGFARAVNLAAEQARGRYLLLVNPDTRPDGPFVAELVETADKHPDAGIYGGRTVREDGADFLAGYGFPTLWSTFCFAFLLSTVARRSALFNPEDLPRLDRSQPGPVPAISGCLFMINRELFALLGGFDPQYFMYCEDADLCLRATRHGAQPMLVPSARVVHLVGRSSSHTDRPGQRKVEMLLKGKITFMDKNWSPGRARIGRLLISTGVALRAFARREPWRSVWRTHLSWKDGWPPVA